MLITEEMKIYQIGVAPTPLNPENEEDNNVINNSTCCCKRLDGNFYKVYGLLSPQGNNESCRDSKDNCLPEGWEIIDAVQIQVEWRLKKIFVEWQKEREAFE
jgi:hypothetical protein